MIVALLHPQFLNRAGTKTVQTTACRESDWHALVKLYHGWGRPVGPRIKERLLGMFLRQETQTFRVCTHKETCAEIQKTVVDYRKVAGSRSGMLPLSLRLVAAAK